MFEKIEESLRPVCMVEDLNDEEVMEFVVFVLETIRTGAMRVIHVIVKTQETQNLRMKFVLYCDNPGKIYQYLSGNGSTSPPLESRHADRGA